MTLILHQFRKDVRQFRIALAIWFGLLLLNLAVNLGWAGRVAYSPVHGFSEAGDTWTNLLPVVIWVLTGVLPSLVVLADSPARREGFLATRPLPKRDLFFAKILFALALVVGPWTLQETIHLAARGMPAWVIVHGTLERLMFTLPVALAGGAYAALWSSYARWARAVAIIGVGGYFSLMTAAMVSKYILHTEFFLEEINLAQATAGLYAVTIILAGLVIWHSRAHRGILARWSALVAVALVYCFISGFWPWNPFALRPEEPAAAKSIMAATDFELSARTLSLQQVQESDSDEKSYFTVAFTPKIRSTTAKTLIEWSGTRAELLRPGGSMIHGGRTREPKIFAGNYWNRSYSTPDFLAWAPDFPSDVVFHQNNMFGGYASMALDFNRFDLPASRDELAEPVTLNASFDARVFQWHKIADLPLSQGAAANDEFGTWKIAGTSVDPESTSILLERRQIELDTARNSRCSSTEYGPLTRMAFMVYDPQLHIGWLPNQAPANVTTRGSETALSYYYSELNYNSPNSLPKESIARGRLIIFEKSWLGSVPESWQSPSFTIDEKLQPANYRLAGNQSPMPHTEFNRRIAALKAPAADAPRRDVALYLLECLRLVDAQTYPLPSDDPHIRQVAAYVPAHLDLLLDGLPVMRGASRLLVLNAIKLGATEGQKPAIIAAVYGEPELAGVLFARGWLDDARPEIYRLAQSSRYLPVDALRAVAWLHDTNTYPRLVEEFEANPNVPADDVLRTLPGLAPQLDAIVSRTWYTHSLAWHQNAWQMLGDPFRLALRHGQVSALQRAYLFLDHPEFDQSIDFPLANCLRDGVLLPDLAPQDRQDARLVLAWMRKHRPEDFTFNPALQQFVLKSMPELTASNP